MKEYTSNFLNAVSYLLAKSEFARYHSAIVAQWMLESDRGKSKLAREFKNFAGIKYRQELIDYAEPQFIKVPSEIAPVEFANFVTTEDFVEGYFKFLDRSPYEGWRRTTSAEDFAKHIGSRWATDPRYVTKVKSLMNEADELIAQIERGVIEEPAVTIPTEKIQVTWWELYEHNPGAIMVGYNGSKPLVKVHAKSTKDIADAQATFGAKESHNIEIAPHNKRVPELVSAPTEIAPGTSEPSAKPEVIWERSPNQSSRNGAPINQIVLHYTTSSNPAGTVSWFKNPASRVSAHYMVGREGKIWQFVDDSQKAWHAAGYNTNTIGIENVAAVGQKLTAQQEQALIKLLKYLMSEYKIPKSGITGHKWLPNSTSCPGSLWETEADLKKWVEQNL